MICREVPKNWENLSANKSIFKDDNKYSRKCLKLIKTPEWNHWQLSDANKEDTWTYLAHFAQVNVCRVGFSSYLQSRISALKWDCP